jgi:hypothetical protein
MASQMTAALTYLLSNVITLPLALALLTQATLFSMKSFVKSS